jgi:hypothetical protein
VGLGWGGLNLKRAALGAVARLSRGLGVWTRITVTQRAPLPCKCARFLLSYQVSFLGCHGMRIVQVGDGVEIASSVLDAAISAKSFVADVANQVVSALTSLGQTVPMLGPCVRVLQDIMAVYKVVPLRQWHTCARAAGSRVTAVAIEMRCRMIPSARVGLPQWSVRVWGVRSAWMCGAVVVDRW